MNKLQFTLVLTVLLLCQEINGLQAQQIPLGLDQYSVSEGLSNSVVNAICQDRYGYIWIGTDDGLNRYDGYSFRTYRSTSSDSASLPNSFILSLYQDKQGSLWVGTQKGLCSYNCEQDNFENHFLDEYIDYLSEDNKGNIICANKGGLRCLDVDSKKIENIGVYMGLHSNDIRGMASMKNGKNLILFPDHLGIYSLHPVREESFIKSKEGELFKQISYNSIDDIAYLLTDRRIIKLRIGEEIIEERSISLKDYSNPGISILGIYTDSRSNLWLSSLESLLRFNPKTGKFDSLRLFNNSKFDRKTMVEVFFEDKTGNIWMGDYGNGVLLYTLNKNIFSHFENIPNDPNSISHNMVSAFAEDNTGKIWLGTWGGGLNYFDPDSRTIGRYDFDDNSLNTEIYRSATIDKNGNLWLATHQNGLVFLNLRTGKSKLYKNDPMNPFSLPGNFVYSLYSDSKGELWIGLGGSDGLSGYDFEKDIFLNYRRDTINDMNIPTGYVRNMIEDKEGRMWLGTYDEGLYEIDRKSGAYKKISTEGNKNKNFRLSNDVIYSILEDHMGYIWIGTMGGGLNFMNPKTHQVWKITRRDGLANDVVNGILEDDRNNLWISTNNGINRISIPEFIYSDTLPDDFPAGFSLDPYILHYDINDGLQNNEFKYASCFKSSSGEMYFGGISGFNVFHPDSIKINKREPEVLISGFSLFNQPENEDFKRKFCLNGFISDLKEIDLHHNQNYIKIDFVAINYNNSQKNRYKYKLEGFDQNWRSADKSLSATYMNLKPGNYIFRVKASNNDGVWTSRSKDLEIKIATPLYGKLWFQFILTVMLFGLLYSFYRYRLYVYKLHSDELEKNVVKRTAQLKLANENLEKSKKEVMELAEKMHETDQMKLRFFTNISHEFRTPLTLITGPLEKILRTIKADSNLKNQLSVVYRNSIRLLKLINELLDFRKLDTGNILLRVTERNIVKFIKGCGSLFNYHAQRREIDFSIIAEDENIPLWFDPDLMEKVIYNLFSNAFKYTPDGGKISIQITRESVDNSNIVKIIVRDNGVGMDEKQLENIFDRFYQIQKPQDKQSYLGSGIGLSLCKDYVKMHHGKITATINPEGGSDFIVCLPAGNEVYSREEIVAEQNTMDDFNYNPISEGEYQGEETLLNDLSKESKLPIILLIDDNPDMLAYLGDILKDSFCILFAKDGQAGINKAFTNLPDLIICDIMMVGIDGYEVIRQLKNNEKTNHIPIILLSARASEEDRIQGLKFGADDYISKPFSARVLSARVNTIIENRNTLKQRFNDEIGFNAASFTRISPNDKFVSKALDVLERNLSNEDFRTEEFASAMGMSRAQLYRKLSSITDQSASEFIRSFRMRKAVEFLNSGEYNVSGVAYKVGFKSLSHFTRTFTAVFKESPTSYLANRES